MFKDFAKGVFYLPAYAVSGISALLLGATYLDQEGEKQNFRGIFGLAVDAVRFVGNFILDATKFVARGITNFITNHQKAIAVAFWSSLVLAGAAALTVAFWPAALAAVTEFTVAGVSIASLVGTGYLAQVGAVAAAATVATSAVVYVGAAVINTFTAIGAFFSGRKKGSPSDFEKSGEENRTKLDGQSRRNPLFDLNAKPGNTSGLNRMNRSGTSSESSSESSAEDTQPVYSAALFRKAPVNLEAVGKSASDELDSTVNVTAMNGTGF